MARAVTECVIGECVRLSGVPGTARGLCSGHYQALRKWGDPLADHRAPRRFCTIDGCEKPRAGRGLCGAHWYHWRTYGDAMRRLPGAVVDGKRICSRCRQDKPLEEFGPSKQTSTGHRTYCKPCTNAKAAEWHAEHPDYMPPPRDLELMRLRSADYRRRNPEYMSLYRRREWERTRAYAKEWRRRNPEAVKTHAAARRVRKRNAFVEPVSPTRVYERDGWRCGVCLGDIDPALSNPHPMSASIDHIVPLARHGKHSMANVQAAHLECNMRKGVKDLDLVVAHFQAG